jgi:hypothetical protein
MTKIGKKAAQDFFCAVSRVFDRVKTVALLVLKFGGACGFKTGFIQSNV